MQHFFQFQGHLKPLRHWARRHGATLALSVDSFRLTVSLAQRQLELIPRFSIRTSQGLAYTNQYNDTGFVGWAPYDFKRWPVSTDKLAFKHHFLQCGLKVPALLEGAAVCEQDYVVKARRGSFGQQVQGPFRPGGRSFVDLPLTEGEFCERFVFGRAVKAWFWNETVAAVEIVDPPFIHGDGRQTVAELLATPRGSMDKAYPVEAAEPMLRWQGLTPGSVVARGRKVWLGFKYVTPYDRPTLLDRDVLPRASDALRRQFAEAGRAAYAAIPEEVRDGCLFTLDAVIDSDAMLWWLEMNSHPMVHPNVYPVMLAEAFDLREAAE
jgi:hypothetical protein